MPRKIYFIWFLLIFSVSSFASAKKVNIPAHVFTAEDTAFVEMVQKACFDFFWNEANPNNGLIKDRDTPGSPCSIASVGFGLSAICIAVEHGWISRSQAVSRVKTTLNTFWNGPQGRDADGYIGYKGFFYHFLDMETAVRTWTSELSSIDTALLLAGMLHAREYFNGEGADEVLIRQLADSIYFRVDWQWMRNFQPNITLGWHPETGFINAWWKGYNEAMIMNILALGSPTYPAPSSIWKSWTSGYTWNTYYGFSYVPFPPLFGHQYSHCWIDFRNIQDEYMQGKGITYFENSRRATLAQRAYCIANPGDFSGYSENVWGITACDGPNGYKARGAPPAQNDDGTIAPTAAGGSIAFTPQESISALRYMYDTYQEEIWKEYGFRDAFNLTQNWWDTDVIGIDEGAMILMMENFLNEGIWQKFMQNEYIQNGLERAGFSQVTSIDEGPALKESYVLQQNYPNPFNGSTRIEFFLPQRAQVVLKIFNILGQEEAILLNRELRAGSHGISLNSAKMTSGIYFYRLGYPGGSMIKRMLILK